MPLKPHSRAKGLRSGEFSQLDGGVEMMLVAGDSDDGDNEDEVAGLVMDLGDVKEADERGW